MRNPSTETIERALYDERSVLRLHGFRNTMWVMTPSMASAMFWSTSFKLAQAQTKRLVGLVESNAITDDAGRWVAGGKATLLTELAGRGTATTRELGAACPQYAARLEVQGASVSAHSRLMMCLGFDGSIVRTRPQGTWVSSQYVWAPMGRWIGGGLPASDPETAAASVLDAYLRAFGPVTTTDIRWWTGWAAGLARETIAAIGAVSVRIDDGEAWMAADDFGHGNDVPAPWVAFLPSLDPTTMGWKQRGWYLMSADAERLFDRNGNAGPTVWMDGRVVGGWGQAEDGEIRYALFDDEAGARIDEVEAEAHRVATFYGETRHRPRFPTPTQRELY